MGVYAQNLKEVDGYMLSNQLQVDNDLLTLLIN
jgi:hypothetical protein